MKHTTPYLTFVFDVGNNIILCHAFESCLCNMKLFLQYRILWRKFNKKNFNKLRKNVKIS